MPERTIVIKRKELILVVVLLSVIVLSIIAVLTRDAWMSLLKTSDEPSTTIFLPISQTGNDPAAAIAESVAIAFNTVDYRDREAWLERMQPLTTIQGFELLKAVYAPITWSLFESNKRVITRDQLSVSDRGTLKQGSAWQIRWVEVHVEDPPEDMPSADIEMRLLLVKEDGAWKFQSLPSETEVEAYQGGG